MKSIHAIMAAFALQAKGMMERNLHFDFSSKSYNDIPHKHRKHRRGKAKK